MSYKKYKDIGNYIVYRDGRVFSKKKGFFLKPSMGKGKSKYFTVQVPERIKLHRLVALHFCRNKHNKPHVNHLDGNKTNNHASNLRWCTFEENMAHAYKYKLINNTGESCGRAKLSKEDVSICREARAAGFEYVQIAKYYGVHPATIRALNIGKSWLSV